MSSRTSKIKEYLTFSRGERNGIILLVVIILLLLLAPIFYSSFITSIPSKNSVFYSQVDSFFTTLSLKPEDISKRSANIVENEELGSKRSDKLFFFDPNTVSVEELVSLGLSPKQANVVDRFRSKGGRFKTPEDFGKVYVIDSTRFKKLKPWIRIDKLALESKPKKSIDSTLKDQKTPIIVELNVADTIELRKIKGIGKILARRIIAYRELLGGYTNITQLNEVYGIKPDLVKTISAQITIDTTRIRLINLNLITFEDLKKHPYLNEFQAKAIIYYRSKIKNIKNVNELLTNKILPPEKYYSIKSYLTIN
jgi:competence protein ComEA